MTAEWQPPPGLKDPFVRRMRRDRAAWTRDIRGRIPELRDIAVAHTIAAYANKDGSNAHPGIERLVDDLLSSKSTIKRGLASLTEAGWLTLTARANRRLGQADIYRLTIPAPLAADMNLWDDEPQWMERPHDEPKRRGLGVTGDPYSSQLQGSRVTPKTTDQGSPGRDQGSRGPYTGVTGEPPPGPNTPGPTSPSGSNSIRVSAAAPTARAEHKPKIDIDPFEADRLYAITDAIETELGGMVDARTQNLIESMFERGAHEHHIVNAALTHERNLPA